MSNPIRQKILATASRLFAERGYELVGINEIISTAEVARASFYNHFKSKELLCLAWLEQEMSSSIQANQQLLESHQSGAERLVEKFTRLKVHLESSNFRGCPFSNTRAMITENTQLSTIIKEYKTISKGFWQEIAQNAGHPPAVGDALFLLYSGATTEAQNLATTSPVDSALEAGLSLLR